MAGDEVLSWHSLVVDFISLARKLEKLGLIYNRGVVIITEPTEELGYV